MYRNILLICLCLSATYFSKTRAMTAEQKAMIHQHFEEIAMECMKDSPLAEEDIMTLKERKMPGNGNAPCFLACVFKNIGLINDEGMLQKEGALEKAKAVFNDSEELKILEDFIHTCYSVNSESVSDGAKGCERSVKAYQCMIENASKFELEF